MSILKPSLDSEVRGQDRHGAGHFGAPRGSRKHNGIDIICNAGTRIKACSDGKVTKIGYPYKPNGTIRDHLRYVQVTDENNYNVRYFYCKALVSIGDEISEGDVIAEAQGLLPIYKGITDHIHFEIKKGKKYINPELYLRSLEVDTRNGYDQ